MSTLTFRFLWTETLECDTTKGKYLFKETWVYREVVWLNSTLISSFWEGVATIPVFSSGKSYGQSVSLVSYHPWGLKSWAWLSHWAISFPFHNHSGLLTFPLKWRWRGLFKLITDTINKEEERKSGPSKYKHEFTHKGSCCQNCGLGFIQVCISCPKNSQDT